MNSVILYRRNFENELSITAKMVPAPRAWPAGRVRRARHRRAGATRPGPGCAENVHQDHVKDHLLYGRAPFQQGEGGPECSKVRASSIIPNSRVLVWVSTGILPVSDSTTRKKATAAKRWAAAALGQRGAVHRGHGIGQVGRGDEGDGENHKKDRRLDQSPKCHSPAAPELGIGVARVERGQGHGEAPRARMSPRHDVAHVPERERKVVSTG